MSIIHKLCIITAFSCLCLARPSWAQSILDKQLLVNPDAEVSGAPGGVPGWDLQGSDFTVSAYGANSDVPDVEGLRIKGAKEYFTGGSSEAQAVQAVDVSSLSGDIDTGGVNMVFSVRMAVLGNLPDTATIIIKFLDANGVLNSDPITLGPQTGDDSVWILYQTGKAIPVGTRSIEVTMKSVRNNPNRGSNAFFDNLSLLLTKNTIPPSLPLLGDLNHDGKVGINDATLSLLMAVGSLSPTTEEHVLGDVNHDGVLDLKDTTQILRFAVGAITTFG